MLSAISEAGIPKGDSWEYEPKWDGFRTLVFRDGDEVALMSRGGRAMTRYFPEVLPAFRKLAPSGLVLDGELIVVGASGLDFGALQQRVHPAESRVRMLAEATPAWFIAFDLLAESGEDLRKLPLGERRKRLEKLLKGAKPPIFLTPYLHAESQDSRGLVRKVRGRRPGRRDSQVVGGQLRARQAALGEDQAQAHSRLRRHRLA